MERYEVLLSPKALRDLDAIYAYIAGILPEAADSRCTDQANRHRQMNGD